MGYPVYNEVTDGDTLPIFFDTFDGGDGRSITMSGFTLADILIYKDGNIAERSSTAGFTLLDSDGIDFDGKVGIHGFSIDTSDDTDAGFYTVGAWFHVVVDTITVDAQTVRFVAAAFRIVAAEDTAGFRKVTIKDGTGAGEIALTAGVVDAVTTLTTLTGHTNQTGDSFTRLGAPTGASISADLVEIEGQTDDIGVAGAGLTAIPIVPANVTQLNGIAQSLLDLKDFADEGYNPATNKITGCLLTDVVTALTGHTAQTGDSFAQIGTAGASLTDLGGMSTGMKDEVNAECDTAISDANLMRALVSGTASGAGTPTTLVDTARTEPTTDYWRGAWLVITGGTPILAGQARKISAFNFTTDTITVDRAFTVATDATTTYEIWPADFPNNMANLVISASGVVEANTVELSGVAQSLLDLKDFADEGYDPATNKITGCLLTDVVTALTGHTVQTGDSFARLGAPIGASISADLVVIESQTDDIGVAGAGLTALPISDANLTQIGGVAQSATDLKDFADEGYNPATNKITGCLLTDVVTTLTGHTAQTGDSFARIGANGAGLTALPIVPANVTQLNGVAQSLLDLKDFADEGYDPGTNKVQGVVLVDTVTALTGHTVQTGDSFARLGAAGASLTDLGGMSTGMKGEVNAEADTAISDANLMRALISGTADSGTTTTLVDTDLTQANDYHNGSWLVITNGTLNGQARRIKDFDAGSDTITLWRPFTVAVGTHTYEIWPNDGILPLPGQEAPPLEPMLEEAIAWLYKNFRNRKDQDSTDWRLYADNETTVDSKATVSDSGSLAIKQEIVSGP